jgi:hypothetical protein
MTTFGFLEARAAIADLVHIYARNVRRGKPGDCAALFTEDAIFEVKEGLLGAEGPGRVRTRLEGHDAIRRYLEQGASGTTRVCPMIHNLLIAVNGLEASSDCVMRAIMSNGQTLLGEYQDRYRYDRGWRFTARIFTIMAESGPRQ